MIAGDVADGEPLQHVILVDLAGAYRADDGFTVIGDGIGRPIFNAGRRVIVFERACAGNRTKQMQIRRIGYPRAKLRDFKAIPWVGGDVAVMRHGEGFYFGGDVMGTGVIADGDDIGDAAIDRIGATAILVDAYADAGLKLLDTDALILQFAVVALNQAEIKKRLIQRRLDGVVFVIDFAAVLRPVRIILRMIGEVMLA